MTLPPITMGYTHASATQPCVPIYGSIPPAETGAQDERPEWLVLVPGYNDGTI